MLILTSFCVLQREYFFLNTWHISNKDRFTRSPQKDCPIVDILYLFRVLFLILFHNAQLFPAVSFHFLSSPTFDFIFLIHPQMFYGPFYMGALSVSTLKGPKKGSPTENTLIGQQQSAATKEKLLKSQILLFQGLQASF